MGAPCARKNICIVGAACYSYGFSTGMDRADSTGGSGIGPRWLGLLTWGGALVAVLGLITALATSTRMLFVKS